MSVIRVKKAQRKPYVVLDTTALNDARLSFRAKGLHTYLMSKPDDWQVYIEQLEHESPKEGRDAIRAALKELIDAGYMKRSRAQDKRTGKMAGWESIVYETPGLADQEEGTYTEEETKNGLSNVGSTEVGQTNIGLTNVGATNIGSSNATYYGFNQALIEPSIEGKEENSLPTVESSPGAGNGVSPPEVSAAETAAAPPRMKTQKPLAADDWVWEELQHYGDEFDINALNDDAWWANVGNSFPDFSRTWVPLAFASLASWLMDNPKRMPRSPRGWKQRMRYSLGWYYDKHMRREAYGQAKKSTTSRY